MDHFWASELAQWVKAPTPKPENPNSHSWNPHGRKENYLPAVVSDLHFYALPPPTLIN